MDIEMMKTLSLQQFLDIARNGNIDFDDAIAALIDAKIEIDDKRKQIEIQLEDAKAKAFVDNEYADRDWFRKARDASRHTGRDSQKIQHMLGILNKEQKNSNRVKVEEKFIQAAKRILDHDTFAEIMQASKEEVMLNAAV